MKPSGIIYYYEWDCPMFRSPKQSSPVNTIDAPSRASGKMPQAHHDPSPSHGATSWSAILGIGLLALSLGGLTAPMIPRLRMEVQYAYNRLYQKLASQGVPFRSYFSKSPDTEAGKQTIKTTPVVFNPLQQPDGSIIEPINKEFSLIIPKIGINAQVIPDVNPTKETEYLSALKDGIAHSSFSYTPDEKGTVYLFSHSTNYDWFVEDLNAVFYLLKNLEEGDTAVIAYKETLYTYTITGKQVVKPTEIEYLLPEQNGHKLILQTCWPPGSISERLLIFADLIEGKNEAI